MNQRTLLDRLLSPAGFGLALLLFLIPLVTVSCGVETERVDATFTGLDLVVGGQPDITGPNIDAEAEAQLAAVFQEDYDVEPLVIVAAVLLLAGMGLALVQQKRIRELASGAVAVVTVMLLAIAIFVRAPGRADAAMDRFRAAANLEESITTTTSPAIGFLLIAVLLLGLAGWQGYLALRPVGSRKDPDGRDEFDDTPHPGPDTTGWPPPSPPPPAQGYSSTP